MRFSERAGLKPILTELQIGTMSDALRHSLWNALDLHIWSTKDFIQPPYGQPGVNEFSRALWFDFYKEPMDERPSRIEGILFVIRQRYYAYSWNEVYDFVEWVVQYTKDKSLVARINFILEKELAGYRLINDLLTEVTDQTEVDALTEALADNKYPGVKAHLAAALRHLSNRDAPDYRNSIKESISAVESMAQVLSGKKATLGDALKILSQKGYIHPALKEGFSKIYGYTSDEGGIRHAMLEEPTLSASDAKFFLLSCTTFINYLKSKL